MPAPITIASGLAGAIGCRLDAPDRIVFAEYEGRLSVFDLAASSHSVLGTGYSELEDVALSADGKHVFVTERAGNLLRVDLAEADRSAATTVAAGLVAPHQIALFEEEGAAWVIEYGPGGRLVEVDLASGAQTVIAAGFEYAVGLVARADRSLVLVTEQAAGGGRLTALDPDAGTREVATAGLVSPFFLSWLDGDQDSVLVTERDPANRVLLVDLASSPPSQRLAVPETPFQPSQAVSYGGWLYVTCDLELVACLAPGGAPPEVGLDLPDEIYVGSFAAVRVDAAAAGVAFDDLEFEVPGGRAAGHVSLSRDPDFDPSEPTVTLLAGYEPGTHLLQVLHTPTGTTVAEREFTLTDAWEDDERSPNKWFNGILPGYSFGAVWGGGSDTVPQNHNAHVAIGTKRIAILFVDTSDQRYTTDVPTLDGFRTRWRQSAFDGVTGADGVTRSVRRFYREVSYEARGLPGIDVTGTVFDDIVHLRGSWDDYFKLNANGNWGTKGEYYTQAITEAGSKIDLTGFNMIVLVSQAVTSVAPPAVVWPSGGRSINVDTKHGRVVSRGISIPNAWGDGSPEDQSNGRSIVEALAHEMGHALDLDDQYKPPVPNRNIRRWDIMATDRQLPHFTLPHRLMLGWAQPAWLKLFNFRNAGVDIDEPVTLSPIEDGPPPPGKFAGIEVRVGDGRNYYFEYRLGQVGQIGDQQLAPDARIVGTDVSVPPDPPVIERPSILLLSKHSDDDGAILDGGDHYHEVDSTTPTFPSDFRLDVLEHTENDAKVRVRYKVIGKPDPSIRPWPKDATHLWQSPDVEVRNARGDADPAWANVPWHGHDNTVVARVRNRGELSASGVTVSFFVKDYTISAAPETQLGDDTHDIAPGATVEFTVPWRVPAAPDPNTKQHFCVIARIAFYETPTTPPVREMTDANNEAQSNYDRFVSARSVPSREVTHIAVSNPLSAPAYFFVHAGQNNPLYRTYLEHSWLLLRPGEQRKVKVMFEYAPDAPQSDPHGVEARKRYEYRPNFVNVVGAIENPEDPELHSLTLCTGVTAEIATGRSTELRDFQRRGDGLVGRVMRMDGYPVPVGAVVLTATDDEGEERSAAAEVSEEGWFYAEAPARGRIEIYYAGAAGYAPSEAEYVLDD